MPQQQRLLPSVSPTLRVSFLSVLLDGPALTASLPLPFHRTKDANLFKKAFQEAQETNKGLSGSAEPTADDAPPAIDESSSEDKGKAAEAAPAAKEESSDAAPPTYADEGVKAPEEKAPVAEEDPKKAEETVEVRKLSLA